MFTDDLPEPHPTWSKRELYRKIFGKSNWDFNVKEKFRGRTRA